MSYLLFYNGGIFKEMRLERYAKNKKRPRALENAISRKRHMPDLRKHAYKAVVYTDELERQILSSVQTLLERGAGSGRRRVGVRFGCRKAHLVL